MGEVIRRKSSQVNSRHVHSRRQSRPAAHSLGNGAQQTDVVMPNERLIRDTNFHINAAGALMPADYGVRTTVVRFPLVAVRWAIFPAAPCNPKSRSTPPTYCVTSTPTTSPSISTPIASPRTTRPRHRRSVPGVRQGGRRRVTTNARSPLADGRGIATSIGRSAQPIVKRRTRLLQLMVPHLAMRTLRVHGIQADTRPSTRTGDERPRRQSK